MPDIWTLGQILFYFMPVAGIMTEAYCLYEFAGPFMAHKRVALSAGLSYPAVMVVLYMMPIYMHVCVAYIVGNIAALLVMCIMDRRNYRQKVFMVVTCFSVGRLSQTIAEILYDRLYYEIMRVYSENAGECFHLEDADGFNTACAGNPYFEFTIYAGVCIFYLAVYFAVMYAGIRIILNVYKDRYADMENKEMLISIIPSFAGITGYYIMYYYRNFYIRETGKNAGAYDFVTLLYCLVSVFTIIAVAVLYRSIRSKREDDMQTGLLTAQIESMRQHIEGVEVLYRDIRGIKHDMTNHVNTLERLYAGNKTSEAKLYMAELKAELSEMAGDIKSGNPVTDIILQEIKNEADKRNIKFESSFYFPEGSGINAFDLSIILNNALYNALENTVTSSSGNIDYENKPYISIISYRRNNAYMMEIRNSFFGELKWNTGIGLPVTSKDSAGGHGFGLSNIRRIARKYSGDMDISVKDGEFCLCIMLMTE